MIPAQPASYTATYVYAKPAVVPEKHKKHHRKHHHHHPRWHAAPPAYVPEPASAPVAATSPTSPYPGGSFGACVRARESGGNPDVMNSSGHYGLYQFSATTWAAYGGNPADFGNASVQEQNQVFQNALDQGGEGNWSPYDGC
jgi:hypothetical protein